MNMTSSPLGSSMSLETGNPAEERPTGALEGSVPRFAILIPCHNESRNLPTLLDAVAASKPFGRPADRIVVVSDQSTDGTDEAVMRFASNSGIPVELLSNPNRGGKARAINQGLGRLSGVDVVVMISGDALPEPGCLESLVQGFSDPTLGVAGGRPVPCGPRTHLAVRMSRLLWDVHHFVAQRSPKTTEITAFRNVGIRLPESTLVDEAEIEDLLRARGFRVQYNPEALVLTQCPHFVSEYVRQRTRVVLGYLRLAGDRGTRMATLRLSSRIHGLCAALAVTPHRAVDVAATLLAETVVSLGARILFALGAGRGGIWKPIHSTKQAFKEKSDGITPVG